jgi:hypothetical protein
MAASNAETIETTVAELAAELKRRGISADERVTVTIEAGPEAIPGRREARARVVAAGLTDADVDRLIKQAQREVASRLEGESSLTRTCSSARF